MCSFKDKARLPVIEFRGVEMDELEVLPVMLFMTSAAFYISGREMITAFGVDAGFYLGMAGKALRAKCFIAEIVAFRAIVHAFETCMPGRQRAG